MELVEFMNFIRLNESQREHYFIEFGRWESFASEMNSIFEKKLEEILSQRISPFLYETKKDGNGTVSIEIKINPNDFFTSLANIDSIKFNLPLPVRLSQAIRYGENITPLTIFDEFRKFGRLSNGSISGIGIDETQSVLGQHLKRISFMADPDLLAKNVSDFAFSLSGFGEKDRDIPLNKLEKFDISQVYLEFLEETGSGESYDFAQLIGKLARYETLLEFFENKIMKSTEERISQEKIDSALRAAASSSPEKEELQSLRTVIRTLMIDSEKGEPDSNENSYLLSKLMNSLMKTHGSSSGIKQALINYR